MTLAPHRFTASLMILLMGVFLASDAFAQSRRRSSKGARKASVSRGVSKSKSKSRSKSKRRPRRGATRQRSVTRTRTGPARTVSGQRTTTVNRRGGTRTVSRQRTRTVSRQPATRTVSRRRTTTVNRRPATRTVNRRRTVVRQPARRTTTVNRRTTVVNRRGRVVRHRPMRRVYHRGNRVWRHPVYRPRVIVGPRVRYVRRPWPVVVRFETPIVRPVVVHHRRYWNDDPYVTVNTFYEWDDNGERWLITRTTIDRPGRMLRTKTRRVLAPEPQRFYWDDEGYYCEEIDDGRDVVEVCEEWDG